MLAQFERIEQHVKINHNDDGDDDYHTINIRLQFINEFQRRIKKHCGKIIRTIGGETLRLENEFIVASTSDLHQQHQQQQQQQIINKKRLERITTLLQTMENLQRDKYISEKRKQIEENCPAVLEAMSGGGGDGGDGDGKDCMSNLSNLQRQSIKLFKLEFKKKILAEKDRNERTRRKETLIEKLKKVEYYERKNQHMKWSSLYSSDQQQGGGVEGDDEGKQNGFLDLENVEKEITSLIMKYNDVYHNRKTSSRKNRIKYDWNEPVMVINNNNQQLETSSVVPPPVAENEQQQMEDAQTMNATTFEKTLPSLFKVGEMKNQFTAPSIVNSSNFLEDGGGEIQIDSIMLQSCLDLKYLKKLRQINMDSKNEIASDQFVYGSSFIRFPLDFPTTDHDGLKYEPKAIKFTTKTQKIRDAIMMNNNGKME